MVVVLAHHIPPAVRGRMKLWFVEPRPNVFVSGIIDSVARDVVEYLVKACPPSSGLLVFEEINKPPGYRMWGTGTPDKKIVMYDGYPLIVEKEIDMPKP
jgi:CRISPR-associated protein Cas2